MAYQWSQQQQYDQGYYDPNAQQDQYYDDQDGQVGDPSQGYYDEQGQWQFYPYDDPNGQDPYGQQQMHQQQQQQPPPPQLAVPSLAIQPMQGGALQLPELMVIEIAKRGLGIPMIFMDPGVQGEVEAMSAAVNLHRPIDFQRYSILSIAQSLKKAIRDLPSPILPPHILDMLLSTQKMTPDNVPQLAGVLNQLAPDTRGFLYTLFVVLNALSQNEEVTQMSTMKLAYAIGPSLLSGAPSGADPMLLLTAPKLINAICELIIEDPSILGMPTEGNKWHRRNLARQWEHRQWASHQCSSSVRPHHQLLGCHLYRRSSSTSLACLLLQDRRNNVCQLLHRHLLLHTGKRLHHRPHPGCHLHHECLHLLKGLAWQRLLRRRQ
ncbi:unnamed protein product (mitochondrion) [Plasmodiophora brassicae]|uniref:Rho-GAP domain-containing protein n=1 Tax=Plasmodiophora brassicae TaxID=37360 RepID=A0A0G4J883_PLABS|nr:hypothetical protein PBRA_003377 [Plasmodiophora brassicae]SPQ99727.1 unnamed protein product [Plasmodiophora brassicae]